MQSVLLLLHKLSGFKISKIIEQNMFFLHISLVQRKVANHTQRIQ